MSKTGTGRSPIKQHTSATCSSQSLGGTEIPFVLLQSLPIFAYYPSKVSSFLKMTQAPLVIALALAASMTILVSAQWITETYPDRQTYVHLFEWKWTDIANECETFLAKYKYGAIQIAPPNEHVMATVNVNGKDDIPWYVKYQPVSYKLNKTRSGTYQELVDMIQRCNKAGVR